MIKNVIYLGSNQLSTYSTYHYFRSGQANTYTDSITAVHANVLAGRYSQYTTHVYTLTSITFFDSKMSKSDTSNYFK
jgi:hypothetical protein